MRIMSTNRAFSMLCPGRLHMAETAGAPATIRHMETYARFLSMTDSEINGVVSPMVQPETPMLEPRRFRKVTALSDFAPVNMKVRKYVVCLKAEGKS